MDAPHARLDGALQSLQAAVQQIRSKLANLQPAKAKRG